MRKGLVILLAVIMTVLPAGTALAAEDTPAAGTQDAGTVLAIDNENLYPGMDQPYSSGYMPAVAGGSASIVLPLVPAQELQGGSINITVDLGDASSSPFVFQNYDKTVGLKEHMVNNGAGRAKACLVELNLPLAEGRLSGRYPVTVSVQGQVQGGAQFTQAFTLYVTVTDGIDPNAPAAQDPGDADAPAGGTGGGGGAGGGEAKPKPKVMLGGYSVNPSPVLAGQEFGLSVTLQNTSDSQPIKNMKVTVSGETADIIPMGETNSFYFKKVAKQESAAIDTRLMVQQTAEPKPQKILLHVEYEGDGGTEVTSDESIVIQVKQPVRIEYDEPEIPQEVNAGDTMSVSMNVMNMGKGTVYNVRAEVEAPGLVPEGSLFLGNLESGAAKKGDLYVFVSTLDSSGADAKYGYTNGKMTLSYEDEFGEVSTQEFDFSTNINPPVINAPQEEEEEEKPETQSQWWISVLILGAVIGGILGIRYALKRRKQKAEDNEDV
ncbi:hypothetical protein A5N82_04070 [Christensenella minuta]|uniref:CARDB domain-containing protein n=1 Tax=Christensenella minuta TaxID=626937 RepID=A0A136Q419_9FIRM|nr:hypothetical protein [Christensenella minuta]AYH40975.1 hypothetical protein B1H56_10910 [Christensenella minuta]KXK65400.1 hypothetical protein HMPREF3293_01612 [Christensenella minuta]MDY3752099.1 hypothetical protein [Christensenella minuta]OAQ42552.1 hypothetical protein A5N82_04070 [Christensenella minuta]